MHEARRGIGKRFCGAFILTLTSNNTITIYEYGCMIEYINIKPKVWWVYNTYVVHTSFIIIGILYSKNSMHVVFTLLFTIASMTNPITLPRVNRSNSTYQLYLSFHIPSHNSHLYGVIHLFYFYTLSNVINVQLICHLTQFH